MGHSFTTDVWAATDFIAVAGVNEGDPTGPAEVLVPDDCYALSTGAQPHRVRLTRAGPGRLRIAPDGSNTGCDTLVRANGTVTLMTEQNDLLHIVLLSQNSLSETAETLWLAPSAPVRPHVSWRIVEVRSEVCFDALMSAGAPSFAQGTRVTLATGRLCPVEKLRAGNRILTRDNGPQPLRAVTHRTARVVGSDTAIRIGAGALNNPRPVVLSAANSLVLADDARPVKAGALVDRAGVTAWRGGSVDYFTLHFDAPETVFAEGISTATTNDASAA